MGRLKGMVFVPVNVMYLDFKPEEAKSTRMMTDTFDFMLVFERFKLQNINDDKLS